MSSFGKASSAEKKRLQQMPMICWVDPFLFPEQEQPAVLLEDG